jgi:hypothetical protein
MSVALAMNAAITADYPVPLVLAAVNEEWPNTHGSGTRGADLPW